MQDTFGDELIARAERHAGRALKTLPACKPIPHHKHRRTTEAGGADHPGAVVPWIAAADFLLLARGIRHAQQSTAQAADCYSQLDPALRHFTTPRWSWASAASDFLHAFRFQPHLSAGHRTAERITPGAKSPGSGRRCARRDVYGKFPSSHWAARTMPEAMGAGFLRPPLINTARRSRNGSGLPTPICRQYFRTSRTSPHRRSVSWAEEQARAHDTAGFSVLSFHTMASRHHRNAGRGLYKAAANFRVQFSLVSPLPTT